MVTHSFGACALVVCPLAGEGSDFVLADADHGDERFLLLVLGPDVGQAGFCFLPPCQPSESLGAESDAVWADQVAAGESPAGPRAVQVHMVPRYQVVHLRSALVRAWLAHWPAWRSVVVVGQIHVKASMLPSGLRARPRAKPSQSRRIRPR